MAEFSLKIVTPEKKFYEGDVEAITFDSLTGRMQILAKHSPYASGIFPCIFTIRTKEEKKYAAVSGGVIEFMDNAATVIADSAEWPDEIDVERAKKAFERAEKRIDKKKPDIDIKRAEAALRRATVRLKAAEIKGSKQ